MNLKFSFIKTEFMISNYRRKISETLTFHTLALRQSEGEMLELIENINLKYCGNPYACKSTYD